MRQTVNQITLAQRRKLSVLITDQQWNTDLLKAFMYKLFETEEIDDLTEEEANKLIGIAENGPEFYRGRP